MSRKDDEQAIQVLRMANDRLNLALEQEREDCEVAILQAYRQHARPWDQPTYTEAINQIRAGNRFPACLSIQQEIELMDRQHEQHLAECRRILAAFRARKKNQAA